MVNKRRQKRDKKDAREASKDSSNDKKEGKREKREEGRWDMLTDAYGRTYWRHSVTGEWSYVYPLALVSPVGGVNPSPVGCAAGPAVFTPSPVPAGYAPYGFVVPPPPAKDSEKEDEGEKGAGWWETMYDEDGGRYWKHTITKKKVFVDPYV